MTSRNYLILPRIAYDHAMYLAELREDHALQGRPVRRWLERESEDGTYRELYVDYGDADPNFVPATDWDEDRAPFVLYQFSAWGVAYLAVQHQEHEEQEERARNNGH